MQALHKTSQCVEMHTSTCRDVRCIVWFILNRSVSLVCHRSSKETSGLSHVEPSWQEETREEVHGGPQCHRRRLTCTGQEGYRHDTAWTEVRMEVKRKGWGKKIQNEHKDGHISAGCVFPYVWRMLQPSGIWAGLTASLVLGVSVLDCGQQTQMKTDALLALSPVSL